ncbi:hypothetical protein L861_08680 [Litchfieldella anticariensis FP35 = DSM 16096]|uniref:Putative metallopeptidase domain-containing protein n=1 Tax=Litchfieldella anticariensis (strain DSM 16096 / CECT 5854 / CIP 108499 / LMG 22089 / FP35) TaxID=1121939 RepID=S2KPP7_LITA3|nr:hypothetical protein [Halomonas anticariensis]EPC02438.1 hypothetical protein L861_08680 [Halomonas anticariensis FP35 = DSM 16096]
MPPSPPNTLPMNDGTTSPPRALTEAEQLLKAEQRQVWEVDRTNLQASHPFIGSLAAKLILVPVIDSRLPTMMTDGHHLFANAHFTTGLTPAARHFLIAHAIAHCIGGHFLPVRKRDIHRWNLACEHIANYLALLEGIALPTTAILYPSQAGKNVMEVYDWLEDHPCLAQDRPVDLHPSDAWLPLSLATVQDPDYRPVPPQATPARHWRELALKSAINANSGTTRMRDYLAMLTFNECEARKCS